VDCGINVRESKRVRVCNDETCRSWYFLLSQSREQKERLPGGAEDAWLRQIPRLLRSLLQSIIGGYILEEESLLLRKESWDI
jgi:hypothetical protein